MSGLTCRSCGASLRHTFIDLGETPLANSYLDPVSDLAAEKKYPLHARVCDSCFLVQVDDVVPPEDIFSDYAYFSSYSQSWVAHAGRYAEQAQQRLNLDGDDLIVEVASNDGYLLKHFVTMGLKVLGIEPAANIAKEAEKAGVPTRVDFFGKDVGGSIRAAHGPATLMAANNVLAHVPDINDFVQGFSELLSSEGVATFEFPHLLEMIREVQFDTIYHEHYSYLSLYAVERCFERHGLRIFDVDRLDTHGGSLRIWCCLDSAGHTESDALIALRDEEEAFGVQRLETYEGFSVRVQSVRDSLVEFLEQARRDDKSVAGYGAAAKGNTLLNYSGITTDLISFVVDSNPHKQNNLLPGSHIPIMAPGEIARRNPDYVVILPWNLRAEIAADLREVGKWDGQCVTAIPRIEVFR